MRIKRSPFRISPQYKKFGPWNIIFYDGFEDDYKQLSQQDQDKVDKIIGQIKIKPYQGGFGQHPLWEFYDVDNECVVWSTEINNKDRLNYLVFKQDNTIKIINLLGHNVMGMNYGSVLKPNVIPKIDKNGNVIIPKKKKK